MVELRAVTIDGTAFQARFAGFSTPLAVARPAGEAALAPWTLRDHLRALRDCLSAGPEGVALDAEAFSDAVLAKSGVEAGEALEPLCLWWAAGGGEAAAALDRDGWADLGSVRARLRPWTEGERQAALRAHLAVEPDGAISLDAVGYLEAMLEASVLAIEPALDMRDCDAAATARLLDAVTTLNVAETPSPAEAGTPELDRALADRTLRICRTLGWMPSQVWAAPAAEVDRIARLIDLVDPPRTPALAAAPAGRLDPLPGHSALVLQPDAIVIRVEDDKP